MSDYEEPAFPHSVQCANGYIAPRKDGMTLRDYFAAKAMPVAMEMLRLDWNRDLGDEWAWNSIERQLCAEHAYRLADLMLAAREAQP